MYIYIYTYIYIHTHTHTHSHTHTHAGLARLRVAMRALSLRRSNAVLANTLPPITVLTHSVRMQGNERYVYDLLFASARAAFMALDAHGMYVSTYIQMHT